MHTLILRPGREKSLKRCHPWVFSGAIDRIAGEPQSGETVQIRSAAGETLALAAYSPHSQIRARVWSWNDETVDAAFFQHRVEQAAAFRAMSTHGDPQVVRLVHGEADGLPGVVADRYGETVVVQFLSAGAERWHEAIADALIGLPGVACVWERSDAEVRQLEGLKERTGLLRGRAPPAELIVQEHGVRYGVEIRQGHKTGFYLDQRDNRLRLRELARDRDVLDCFCYTGGFALNAAAGGARSVTAIDSAPLVIERAQANAALNGASGIEWIAGDVFQLLRRFRDQQREFDVIVLDPPKFAPTAAHAQKAARAYKDINLLAFKLLRSGGMLMTFSCSGGVSAELFQKIVAGAALDAGADARVAAWLHASADHPVALSFPESEYLKGLLCRVDR
ncbi:MAG TPA: class I SAM-dependent methyltransferase [Burkholderiales bacterium]|nr:class I SAM-dependent methyltransferase [Burkholderiales bacterium]